MRKSLGWIAAIVLGILLLVVLVLPLMLGGFGFASRPYGGMMGRDFGYMHPMGWAGMGIGWLFMLAFLVLLGLGIASLIKYLSEPRSQPGSHVLPKETNNCSNCGKPSQTDWNTCPYCGNQLK